jgi:hypothetical protein
MLRPNRPGIKAGVDDAARPSSDPPDPRLKAFSDLVRSVDRDDWKAGQLATRELRALGFSVCLIKPPGERGSA